MMCLRNQDKNGTKNDVLHRDHDLPAVSYDNGRIEWYQHGVLHRDGELSAGAPHSQSFRYE